MPVSGNSVFGFPLGWDYRHPDQPDFGGPVRNLQTGNFEQPRALSVVRGAEILSVNRA